jgi:putative transposase
MVILMEIVKSVHFGIEQSEQLSDLITEFVELVNWCIQKCVEHNVTSRSGLHTVTYEDYKKEFNLASHYFHSAGMIATQILRSWRKLCRKGKADWNKPPVFKNRNIRLESCLWRFYGNKIRLTIRNGEHIWINLRSYDYQNKHVEEWQKGNATIGEITFSDAHVKIPFKYKIEPRKTNGVCGIDINEQSIDMVIINSNNEVKTKIIPMNDVKGIKDGYFKKRRKIQKLSKTKPKTSRKLIKKYSRREKNRVNQKLHEKSKEIARIIDDENVMAVMEDLTDIRDDIQFSREMNRRLHSWNFRDIQQKIEYKVQTKGLNVEYVNPKDTSRECPICGRINRPNGHTYKCANCGLIANRHIVGAWNIALKCGELPLPPNATYDIFGGGMK